MTRKRKRKATRRRAAAEVAAAATPAPEGEAMFDTDDNGPPGDDAATVDALNDGDGDDGAGIGNASDAAIDAAEDAFEAARDKLAEADEVREPTAAPSTNGDGKRVRSEIERKGNRWRSRNLRRKRNGERALTDAEQEAADAAAGITEATQDAAPGRDVPVARDRPARATRAQLETEVAQLRAQVDVEEKAFLARALGETFRTIWDVTRRFTPSNDRELTDSETSKLGDAWAPVMGPKMAALATAAPWMIAASVTFRIVAPRVESALTEPAPVRTVAAGSESARVSMDPAREVSPSEPAAPRMDRVPGSEGVAVPPGADPTQYGYSPGADAL